MHENSILILFSGEPAPKCGDELYPFTPKRNFYYLTGIDAPRILLTIYKKDNDTVETTLYLERFDEIQAKWVGAVLGKDEAKKKSGIDGFGYTDDFKTTVTSLIFTENIKYVYMDMENRHWDQKSSKDIAFANDIRRRFPAVDLMNAYYIFGSLRIKKSKDEIRHIQNAIKITGEGLNLMMRNSRPGMMEYEIEAYFDYTLKRRGVKDRAFATIAASGKNATVLHYNENNAKTNDGDLILFDLGAQIGYYSADITRTFPVSGKFSERQKTLYNIVLGGQKKVIDAIKPGIPFASLNDIIKDYYYKELKKIGLIEKKEDVSKYYYHSIGHMLGLETHDIGRSRESILQKGMVFTVEPGLYIEDEAIGIRIEDDVVVTDKGCEVLSADIIKTVEEIEAFMRG
jgi:Xaa-Pro aminopeptidase